MSAWRVGSKTKVTLFKGDELYGMLLDEEKAAVVVANLNRGEVEPRSVKMPVELPRERCPDCEVEIGVEHSDGCDVAQCLYTGFQCLARVGDGHDCGNDAWSGFLPGVLECMKLGWVTVDHRDRAVVWDVNRLMTERRWSREDLAWVRK